MHHEAFRAYKQELQHGVPGVRSTYYGTPETPGTSGTPETHGTPAAVQPMAGVQPGYRYDKASGRKNNCRNQPLPPVSRGSNYIYPRS